MNWLLEKLLSGRFKICVPFKWFTKEIISGEAITSISPAHTASLPLTAGQIKPQLYWLAEIADDIIPLTELIEPSRDNSPITKYLLTNSCEMTPISTIIPSAIAKSKCPPSFCKSAGAKLTVIFSNGQDRPEEVMAHLTLYLDSPTDLSGKPTKVNSDFPDDIFTWTSTGKALMPLKAKVLILATILEIFGL